MVSPPAVAIVGGESLLGNELRSLLAESVIGANLKLVGSEEEPGVAILSEQAGEPVVITGVDEETLAAARIVFFAGTPHSTRKALARTGASSPLLVDLTHVLEEKPEARLRGPSAEPPGYRTPETRLYAVAHPAAIVLAGFLRRLHGLAPVRRAVAQIHEPASERGRAGVNELQQQTIDLLSFRPPQKRVFDEQLSFNLLAAYGEEAPVPLETVAHRIEKHLATLLALEPHVPMPSLRLIQAPVMHGHTISLWVEHEADMPAGLRSALASDGIDVYAEGIEPPNVVGIAGQSGMTVGAIEADRNNHRAAWYWIVADNFRVAAENAIAVARAGLLEEAGRA